MAVSVPFPRDWIVVGTAGSNSESTWAGWQTTDMSQHIPSSLSKYPGIAFCELHFISLLYKYCWPEELKKLLTDLEKFLKWL